MAWDKAHLEGKLEASDIVLAAKRLVPELRAKSDLLIALCHAGIKAGPWTEGEENAALHLAAVPGIDVIMTGHAHRVFPGKDYAGLDGVDAVRGRLNGVPAVMPGFWGSHLGVVDLILRALDHAGGGNRNAPDLPARGRRSERTGQARRASGGVNRIRA
jgi:2',3'-cyclic-nucleotide 2'-phosphodiesterase/3'-nucleotidase